MRFNQSPEHNAKMQTDSQLIPPLFKFVFCRCDNTIPRSSLVGKGLILLTLPGHSTSWREINEGTQIATKARTREKRCLLACSLTRALLSLL